MNSFAFLAYPTDLTQLSALNWIPGAAHVLRKGSARPAVTGRLTSATHPVEGHVITLPWTVRQLQALPAEQVKGRLQEALSCAQEVGASVVGLGALTGQTRFDARCLQGHPGVSITGGWAYRGASILLAVERLLKHLPRFPHVAVLGAQTPLAGILMPLLETLPGLGGISQDTQPDFDLQQADLLVVLGEPARPLQSQPLRQNAMVLNAAPGWSVDPRLLRARADVVVTDPAVFQPTMRIPGLLGHTALCSSLTETVLLSLSEQRGHFALGMPTTSEVKHIGALLRQHPNLQVDFQPVGPRRMEAAGMSRTMHWI